MTQRLLPMAEEGFAKEGDSKASSEEVFAQKLKQIESRLGQLQVLAEEKKNRTMMTPSSAGSPIIGEDNMRKSIQTSSDAISTPLLGPYNIRIPTTFEQRSPNSGEHSPLH